MNTEMAEAFEKLMNELEKRAPKTMDSACYSKEVLDEVLKTVFVGGSLYGQAVERGVEVDYA